MHHPKPKPRVAPGLHVRPEAKKPRTFDESVQELTGGQVFTNKQLSEDSFAGNNIHRRRRIQ